MWLRTGQWSQTCRKISSPLPVQIPVRWMGCSWGRFLMRKRMGTRGRDVPVETQFLLVEVKTGEDYVKWRCGYSGIGFYTLSIYPRRIRPVYCHLRRGNGREIPPQEFPAAAREEVAGNHGLLRVVYLGRVLQRGQSFCYFSLILTNKLELILPMIF
nr:probable galactinol--sucrose galactosyltransferase 6 [Ipomoea batatas]